MPILVLQRNFPRYFPSNNAHSFFLFSTPSAFSERLRHSILLNYKLSFEKPAWPQVHVLTDLDTYRQVFEKNAREFPTLYGDQLKLLTDDYGCVICLFHQIILRECGRLRFYSYLLGFDAGQEQGESKHPSRHKASL